MNVQTMSAACFSSLSASAWTLRTSQYSKSTPPIAKARPIKRRGVSVFNGRKITARVIQRIAADPAGTFDLWKGAERPFSYVAACLELAQAWADPDNCTTYLPISYDASANGLQRLALLCRDADTARRVNLIDSEAPRDVYADIIARVRKAIATDNHKWATWWRKRLKPLTPKQSRKLFKTPASTFAYSVTDDGMIEQINDVYRGLSDGNEPRTEAARYLAKKIREACKELLPGPAGVMQHICDLADYCREQGRFMEWTSPTKFPAANSCQESNIKTVYLVSTGVEVRHRVADGCLPKIRKKKTRNAAAPNFVHSMDAAHLVRVVLAAQAEGIHNVVTVHDSFACLASQARRFHYLIRRELLLLYARQDHLDALGRRNGFPQPPPIRGDLDIMQLLEAEFLIS